MGSSFEMGSQVTGIQYKDKYQPFVDGKILPALAEIEIPYCI